MNSDLLLICSCYGNSACVLCSKIKTLIFATLEQIYSAFFDIIERLELYIELKFFSIKLTSIYILTTNSVDI